MKYIICPILKDVSDGTLFEKTGQIVKAADVTDVAKL